MSRLFAIVTDSACDMPKAYYVKHNVEVAPLGFTMDNVNYEGESGQPIDEKTFYAKLRGGSMPTTYQITAEQAREHIEPILKAGNDVLVLTFSSALSGTSGSFTVACRDLATEYPERKICVVDSLCASMGQGLLLDYVIRKADEGASLEDTAKYAEALKLKICHHFTVDNLFHLKRGGRVSGATAIIGSVLKIKPIMRVDKEGRLKAIGKAMGRKKSLSKLVENMLALADMTEDDPIFISHGDCIEDVEFVKEMIVKKLPKNPITVHYIGSVIGTHSGCGTLAIFHKGKHR
ncbi:MAG: DegV family protein [Clostridiales bacterium]|nr:DegV family protein [Clostridiales bacterium]